MDFLLTQIKRRQIVIRFLFSGGTALATNLALLYLFIDLLHMWYLSASVFAFAGAFSVSFLLQKFFTFKNKRMDTIHVQISMTLAVALGNLALNTFLMYLMVDGAGLYHLLAQTISSGVIACESFFLYRHLVFRNPKEQVVS